MVLNVVKRFSSNEGFRPTNLLCQPRSLLRLWRKLRAFLPSIDGDCEPSDETVTCSNLAVPTTHSHAIVRSNATNDIWIEESKSSFVSGPGIHWTFLSWNARNLWHTKRAKRFRKLQALSKAMRSHNFVCIQESGVSATHSDSFTLWAESKGYHAFFNFASRSRKRGCIILVRTSLFVDFRFTHRVIISQFVHFVSIRHRSSDAYAGSMFNVYFSSRSDVVRARQIKIVGKAIKPDNSARRFYSTCEWWAGDFNFVFGK